MARSISAIAAVFFLAGPGYSQDRNAILTLAQAVASPVCGSFDDAIKSQKDPAVLLRNEVAYQRLVGVSKTFDGVDTAREKSVRSLSSLRTSLENLRRYDSRTPDYKSLAEKTVQAGPALYQMAKDKNAPLTTDDNKALSSLAVTAGIEVVGSIANAYNSWSERKTYKETYSKMRREAAKDVRALCEKAYTSTSSVTDGFGVSVSGSLNNFYSSDDIQIRNTTGQKLTNCVVTTEIEGYNAETGKKEYDYHIHFAAVWPNDLVLYASYPSRRADGIATNQSADAIDKVVVRVYSDQLTGSIDHQYIGKNYDADLKRYVEEVVKPKFTGTWTYYPDKHALYNTGHSFSFKGERSSMPVSHVTVKVTQGKREQSVRHAISGGRMSAESRQWLSDAKYNSYPNPDKVKIVLEFPRSSYTYSTTWNYKK